MTSAPGADSGAEESPIRVVVRLRPAGDGARRCLAASSPTTVELSGRDGCQTKLAYDNVLDEACSQEDVFEQIKPAVQSTVQGYNGSIIAYGQTGSGKTHTLIGEISTGSQNRGLLSRSVEELARCISTCSNTSTFEVSLSVVEIYCERIRCLLSPPDAGRDNLGVVNEAPRGIFVAGAAEVPVESEKELLELMHIGISNRTVSATAMNAMSSRSHCITYLMVRQILEGGKVLIGKLTLVDLAGSERQIRTGAEGTTFEEGKLINKSLSALGNVINLLADGRSQHVPYRDSKLTRVLQDSLGGCAKTFVIVCCSPDACDATESLSSLRFGTRAKGIVNALQAPAQQTLQPEELVQQLAAAQKECVCLREQLADLQQAASQHSGDLSSSVLDDNTNPNNGPLSTPDMVVKLHAPPAMNRAINSCNKQEAGLLFLQWCLHLVFIVISVLLLAMLTKLHRSLDCKPDMIM